MITRATVEMKGKCFAGAQEVLGPYTWSRVLGMFDMYSLNADGSVSPHLVKDGYWESWITTWFINNVGKRDNFIDIGANTGYYSFLANSLGAGVVAFEPNPTYAKMMVDTIKRANIDNMRVLEYALSNYNGTATLNIPKTLHGSASLNSIDASFETDKIEVAVRQLDEIMPPQAIREIIKIDAEGEEERILEGAKGFLKDCFAKVVLLEYTPNAYSDTFLDELFDKWHVTWINFAGEEERVTKDWIRSQPDWIMLVLR